MAYKTCIKTAGALVATSGESMEQLSAGIWRVTNPARRVLSDTNPQIEVESVVADPADYTLDTLTGTVVFTANVPAGADTVEFVGGYYPVAHVARATSYQLDSSVETEDVTTFEDIDPDLLPAGAIPGRVYAAGDKSVTATLNRITHANEALWLKAMIAGSKVLLQLVKDNGDYDVGWFHVSADNFSANRTVSRESVSFVLSGQLSHVLT